MDHQKEFFDASYQKLVDAIQGIPDDIAVDIYAFTFIFYDDGTYSSQLVMRAYYTTESHFKASIDKAYDEMEAKWFFDFWLLGLWDWFSIGGLDDELWQKWTKSTSFYHTEEEGKELHSKDERKFWEHCKGTHAMFEDTIIDLSQKLHTEGVFVKKFGKPIPVIVQFYEPGPEQIEWTLRANPKGVADEYVSWANDYLGCKKT
ncbi:MAG: hypothetical protein FWH27_03840 [Planctomycetaceae bacterium]|nr:hypothetical protein [Planctomycetaceae bacterium]